jgi:hypothetical protein
LGTEMHIFLPVDLKKKKYNKFFTGEVLGKQLRSDGCLRLFLLILLLKLFD